MPNMPNMELVGEVGGRLVPIPRVASGAISAGVFLSDVNLSLNPQAPRDPVTFQPLSAPPPVAPAAAATAMFATEGPQLSLWSTCCYCSPGATAAALLLLYCCCCAAAAAPPLVIFLLCYRLFVGCCRLHLEVFFV